MLELLCSWHWAMEGWKDQLAVSASGGGRSGSPETGVNPAPNPQATWPRAWPFHSPGDRLLAWMHKEKVDLIPAWLPRWESGQADPAGTQGWSMWTWAVMKAPWPRKRKEEVRGTHCDGETLSIQNDLSPPQTQRLHGQFPRYLQTRYLVWGAREEGYQSRDHQWRSSRLRKTEAPRSQIYLTPRPRVLPHPLCPPSEDAKEGDISPAL